VIAAVANDPRGVGVAPVSACDPARVRLLSLRLSGGVGPEQAADYPHLLTGNPTGDDGWLLQYPIRARVNNPANPAAVALLTFATNPNTFGRSLLFRTAYFPPRTHYPNLCGNW